MTKNQMVLSPVMRNEDPTKICVECEATLKVLIRYGRPVGGKELSNPVQDGDLEAPPNFPIEGVTVKLDGPSKECKETDASGIAVFDKLKVGKYKITAVYEAPKPRLVELAESKVGSADWAKAADRTDSGMPFSIATNKCNLFVYQMATGSGYEVPRWQRRSWTKFRTDTLPPLAGHWGDPDHAIVNWQIVKTPRIGDIVSAPALVALGASGHVGIVAGPEPNSAERDYTLSVGIHQITMRLPWTTISAGEFTVSRKEWPYDAKTLLTHKTAVFRRYGH